MGYLNGGEGRWIYYKALVKVLACLACVAVALPDTGYSEGREGLGLDNVL